MWYPDRECFDTVNDQNIKLEVLRTPNAVVIG